MTDGQVMVPGIDLADHNPNPTCHLIQDRNNTFFSLIANKKIEIGDSLTINYGPLSSDELLSAINEKKVLFLSCIRYRLDWDCDLRGRFRGP